MSAATQEVMPDKFPSLQEQFGGPLDESLLVQTLMKLAKRDPEFADYDTAETVISLTQGDVAEDLMYRTDKKGKIIKDLRPILPTTIRTQYLFEANRQREIYNADEVLKDMRNLTQWLYLTTFALTVTVAFGGEDLPDTLAVERFAYDPEQDDEYEGREAVTPLEAVGEAYAESWTKELKKQYIIRESEETLFVRETIAWYSSDGELISERCACNDLECSLSVDHIKAIPGSELDDDEGDEDDWEEDGVVAGDDEDWEAIPFVELRAEEIPGKFGPVLLLRPEHEKEVLDDLAQRELDEVLGQLETSKRTLERQHRREIRHAFTIIRTMDKMLQQRAGLRGYDPWTFTEEV